MTTTTRTTATTHTDPALRTYFVIFAALMALLGLTIGAGYIDFGALNLPIAMSISVLKTLLIILFFMHVRYASRLTAVFACAGFVWLCILLVFAMGDYVSRHW